jgi:hypothetical protein
MISYGSFYKNTSKAIPAFKIYVTEEIKMSIIKHLAFGGGGCLTVSSRYAGLFERPE